MRFWLIAAACLLVTHTADAQVRKKKPLDVAPSAVWTVHNDGDVEAEVAPPGGPVIRIPARGKVRIVLPPYFCEPAGSKVLP